MRDRLPRPPTSFETTRTYPLGADVTRRAVTAAVEGLARWEVVASSGDATTAVRSSGLGSQDVSVRLQEEKTGAHTNTHAYFRSVSRWGVWDLGRNKRNLQELLDAVDRELRARPPTAPKGPGAVRGH